MTQIVNTPCKTCGEDAFRYCSECRARFCQEHICGHLALIDANLTVEEEFTEYQVGYNWLSNDAVIASFTDEKLREALARYEGLVVTIKMEIARRSVTPAKPKRRLPAAIELIARAAGMDQDEAWDFYKFVRENAKTSKSHGKTTRV